MHDLALEQVAPRHLQSGITVSVASIIWTIASSVGAISLGIAAGSLVLLAFGLSGILDAAGSTAIVIHFRHALHHESFSAAHERRALRIVTAGLFLVGALTLVESVRRLVEETAPRPAPIGAAIAACSIVALGILSFRKRVVARRIPSRALLADGSLSATGCLLATTTVLGVALNGQLGWWWADPAAAAAVACGAIASAVVMNHNESP